MEEDKQGDSPSSKKIKANGILALVGAMSNFVFGVDITDADAAAMPENALTDFNNDAWAELGLWRFSAVVVYQASFIALLIYFIYSSYNDAVSNSFISLDSKAGVCKGDKTSTTCCEVPQTITGTFLADTRGKWNTQNGFSYINNNYAVTVAGLEYTNEQWADVMKNITAQLSTIGLKGENRDYAWNMVAWSSFTAQNLDRGFLQFYSTGLVSVMLDKPISNKGVASAASQTAECNQPMDTSYSSSTSILDVSITLCDSDDGCPDNPCPDVLAPQAMGYDVYNSELPQLDLAISMQSVYTALAVNLGMISLNHLVMVPGDNDRITLFDAMVTQGSVDATVANHTTSYFDQRLSPSPPIYCYSANTPVQDSNTWVSGNAFCLVRLGNVLAYPVTTSYGWSSDGTSYPTQCTKSAASVAGTAAKFYCNKFDINVGLIYYPVANQNTSYVWTYRPTTSPTPNPSPRPGDPTTKPTSRPTIRPSNKPSPGPTPIPGAPTAAPSTLKPTRKPSPAPTAKPSRSPTGKPSPAPTVSPSKPPTLSPSVAFRNTFSWSASLLGAPTEEPTAAPTEAADDDDDDGGNYGGAYYGGGDYAGGDDDLSAADDQYATTGVGTYSNPYYANSATDDFVPLIPPVVDNGKIFAFGAYAAAQLNKVNASNGDLFVSNNAYYAMVDTVAGTLNDKSRSYKKDFNKLCSSSVEASISAGCAMMAFNFNAANSRDISNYYYQPSSTPAFSNTLYVKNELIALQKNTPTSLIQTYYSCVLAPWPAFVSAVGIGSSSAGVFLTVGFAFYVFSTMMILNWFFGVNIPSKKRMEKMNEAAAELKAKEAEVAAKVVEALRADVISGRVNLPTVADALRATEGDLREARAAAAEAGVRMDSVPAGSRAPSAGPATPAVEIEMNPMRGAGKV